MLRIFRSLIYISVIYCNYVFALDSQIELIPVDVVFHGTDKKDMTILEPKADHIRDKDEGAVVFATSSVRLASSYLFR